MSRNLELKVRCSLPDHERVCQIAMEAHATGPCELRQRDTYFEVPHGRLKLRRLEIGTTSEAELIQYTRPDSEGMRLSTYRRTSVPTDLAEYLEASLADALGILTVVEKVRSLLILGTTRIHLDQVNGLGHFIELETVLGSSDDNLRSGRAEYDRVVALLGLGGLEPVPGSYSDLMLEGKSSA